MVVGTKRQNKTPLYIDNELHEKLDGYKDKLFINEYRLFATIVCDLDLDLKRNNIRIDDLPRLYRRDYHITPKYEVGQYYFSIDRIFKVIYAKAKHIKVSFHIPNTNDLHVTTLALTSDYDHRSRPATNEEIELFKRAETFHKCNRKLDEFRNWDIVMLPKGEILYYDTPLTHHLHDRDLKLICPVENRVDIDHEED